MSRKLRIGYLAHSLRSDWNNGNAHFLRGLLRALQSIGSDVVVFEPERAWSIDNLGEESLGGESLRQFDEVYPDLNISLYDACCVENASHWRSVLRDLDVVILHEWNPPSLAETLLQVRDELGFRLMFHDTHHRACSAPTEIRKIRPHLFDGVLVFGESLRAVYRGQLGVERVWTLHEGADTTVFQPRANGKKKDEVIWIGNWGDNERSHEICEFLLKPAAALRGSRFVVHGVRYPEAGRKALREAGVDYSGYLANLEAPAAYAASHLTVHIPRRQYATAMKGIPTIRVFEALACGIPLISAPWEDSEHLFREGDFVFVRDGREMKQEMERLLGDAAAREAQARRGMETVLARHTCRHRAEQLLEICEEVMQ